MARILSDWHEAYMEYTAQMESPRSYREWVGVFAICAALQRKCYLNTFDLVFPNLYVILVGPPSSRKGTAMKAARRILERIPEVSLASNSITREGFIVELSATKQAITDMPIDYDSSEVTALTAFCDEMSVFTGYDQREFIALLTDLFDCRAPWRYRTKTSGIYTLPAVWFNFIAGTTPDDLQEALPASALTGGLAARSFLVTQNEPFKHIFREGPLPDEVRLFPLLLNDLTDIAAMKGKFDFTREANAVFKAWYEGPQPNHLHDGQLAKYADRRGLHISKLSIAFSASRGDTRIIELEDFERARQLLERMETGLPDLYLGYGRVRYATMIPQVWKYLQLHDGVSTTKVQAEFMRDLDEKEFDQLIRAFVNKGAVKVVNGKLWKVRSNKW